MRFLHSVFISASLCFTQFEAKACCYVHNLATEPITVTTKTGSAFQLDITKKKDLSKSDYPVTITYVDAYCTQSLRIDHPGCDSISGAIDPKTGRCYPLHHVNWCLGKAPQKAN